MIRNAINIIFERLNQTLTSARLRGTKFSLHDATSHLREIVSRLTEVPRVTDAISRSTRFKILKGLARHLRARVKVPLDTLYEERPDGTLKLRLDFSDADGTGGFTVVRDQAHVAMRKSCSGFTLSDKEVQALEELAKNLGLREERAKAYFLDKKMNLLYEHLVTLTDVLEAWFEQGIQGYQIPEVSFRMSDIEGTLTLQNYLPVNRTIDDAKVLKNFASALDALYRQFQRLLSMLPPEEEQQWDYVKQLRDRILDLLCKYHGLLARLNGTANRVRRLMPSFVEALISSSPDS